VTSERWQRVKELFEATLERDPAERAAFLAQACGGDEEVRREVESLLAAHEGDPGFMNTPVGHLLAGGEPMLAAGQRFGPYETISPLGEGGMGQVYLAVDTRLGRKVALKLLPSYFTDDADRVRRFEREARAASALNHPSIITIYEIGQVDGRHFISAEYVAGETLRARLERGRLEAGEALNIAVQVASALASAHEAGIVHRDIKPENIMLRRDRIVKVLDFGLAKLAPHQALAVEPQAPNKSTVKTNPGVVMGTVGYMSPEQARGQGVDHRTDIFSFGAMLYEMLTGKQAFGAGSLGETMSAILRDEPEELTRPDGELPPQLASIVRRCLEKKPEQRFQSASDLEFALEALASTSAPPNSALKTSVTSGPRHTSAPRYRYKWLAPIAVLAALIVAGVFAWRLGRSDYWWRNPLADAQFTPLTDFPESERDAQISRDGKLVAFVSDRDGPLDIWVGQIGTGEFQNLTKGRAPDIGNPRVRNLTFSPDSSQVALEVRIAGRSYTWAVPTMGGPVRPYIDGKELAWSPDGARMVYHTDTDGDPIFVMGSDEKTGQQIHTGERGVHCHFPVWSPDGAFIYFVRGFPTDEMDIWRIRPTGGSAERITFLNTRVAYPTFLNERTLLYIAMADDGTGPWLYGMDVEKRIPHRVSFGVERYMSIAASADGRRLVATVANPDASLWRVPISDQVVEESAAQRIELPTMRDLSPRIGPGYLLYLSSKGGNDGIWKFADGSAVELWSGSHGRLLEGAAVSPDGRRIAFTAQKGGRNRLYLMNSTGTSVTELTGSLNVRGTPAWPPVGEWITVAADQGKSVGLFNVPLDGGPPIQLVAEQAANPVWSPDGHFLVYSGVEVGTTFPLKAITADGKPYPIPELTLARGASRFSFLPGRPVLVVLKGDVWLKNFWLVDLVTGQQRQLTNFGREYLVNDFDVSPDGKEIVFGRQKENANIVLIDLPETR
jgi:serine/threonine protein kinase/Tol biopolymer transport system component